MRCNFSILGFAAVILVGCQPVSSDEFTDLFGGSLLQEDVWLPPVSIWNDCQTAGACPNRDGGSLQNANLSIPHNLSQRDATDLLNWINSKALSTWRLPEAEEEIPLDAFVRGIATLRGKPCFEDRRFQKPTSSLRERLQLPDDWPYRIDPASGVICRLSPCESCSAFHIENDRVAEDNIPAEAEGRHTGIIFIRGD